VWMRKLRRRHNMASIYHGQDFRAPNRILNRTSRSRPHHFLACRDADGVFSLSIRALEKNVIPVQPRVTFIRIARI